MFELKIDEEKLERIVQDILEEKLTDKISPLFLDRKQLEKYLNMSWNSIADHFLYEEGFPKVRLGNKWLFPKEELDEYMRKNTPRYIDTNK